jgi:hypothetical protein
VYSSTPITQNALSLSSNDANGGTGGAGGPAGGAGAQGGRGDGGGCFCFAPIYGIGANGKDGAPGDPGAQGSSGGQGIGSFPDVFVGNTPLLVVTTPSLPDGVVGTEYQAPAGAFLNAAGGVAPYSWTVTAGALPPGLTLSSAGDLFGTPAINGDYQFTVQVADSSATQLSATSTFDLHVTGVTLAPPPPPAGSNGSASGASSDQGSTASASLSGLAVTAPGAGAFTVATYGSDPVGAPDFDSSGAYFDLASSTGSTFTSLTVQDCALAGGSTLYYWTGTDWQQVSNQTPNTPSTTCTTMALSADTSPSISDLTGTVFGVGIPYSTPGFYDASWNGFLGTLDCPSSSTCLVGGNSGSGALMTLKNAAPDSIQALNLGSSGFAQIACATPSQCYGVGNGGFVPVSNGTAGAVTTAPPGVAIACESATICWVADRTDAEIYPIIGGLPGATQTVATPSGFANFQLSAITCATATLCYVAGYGGLSGGGFAGEVFPISSDLLGTGQKVASLDIFGITCPSSDTCDAVGADKVGGAFDVLTDGIPATEQSVAGVDDELTSIACIDVSDCFAVGDGDTTTALSAVVVPITNGAAGTPTFTQPNTNSFLYGVSCPSTTYCIAVGFDSDANTGLVLSFATGMAPPGPPSLVISAADEEMFYGGPRPLLDASYAGFTNSDTPNSLDGTLSCVTTATSSSPVGQYPINCSGQSSNNYTITYDAATMTVFPAPLTITAQDVTINQGDPLPSFGAGYSGFVNGDQPDSLSVAPTCSTTVTDSSVAGTYPITCSGATDADYAISYVAGVLNINPSGAKPTLTITASDATMDYGSGTLPSFTPEYNGFVNGDGPDSLATAPSCSTTASVSDPVGDYAIVCSGAVDSNYTIEYASGTFSITAVPLNVAANSADMSYGGSLPSLSAGYAGFVNGDGPNSLTTPATCTTTAVAFSPVGSYPITCSGAVDPNYTISYTPDTLNVTVVGLTISADDASMVEGSSVPVLGVEYAGFVNGDGSGSLTTSPSCVTTADSNSPPGTYEIDCSDGADPNYTISYVPGTLTIFGNSVRAAASYDIPSGPSVTFTMSLKDSPTGQLTGSLKLASAEQWRIGGRVTSYVGNSPTSGTAGGFGRLEVWNSALHKGSGAWQEMATGVPFQVVFDSNAETFGIQIAYTPTSGQPPLPNSGPEPLVLGSLRIR